MVGNIQLENFKGLTKMPQKAASAWAALDALVGCRYTPLLYLGEQIVKGVNHWFIAERSTVTLEPTRNVVLMAINEFNGEYTVGAQPIVILA